MSSPAQMPHTDLPSSLLQIATRFIFIYKQINKGYARYKIEPNISRHGLTAAMQEPSHLVYKNIIT